MFTVSNNMIDVKKSKGRLHFQSPSNKEIGFSKYHLPTKFSKNELSSTKLLKAVPYKQESFKRDSGVLN